MRHACTRPVKCVTHAQGLLNASHMLVCLKLFAHKAHMTRTHARAPTICSHTPGPALAEESSSCKTEDSSQGEAEEDIWGAVAECHHIIWAGAWPGT